MSDPRIDAAEDYNWWPDKWLLKAIDSATSDKVLSNLLERAPLVSIAISLHRIANALEEKPE